MRFDRIVRIETPGPGCCTSCASPLLDHGAVDGVAYTSSDGSWLCLRCAASTRERPSAVPSSRGSLPGPSITHHSFRAST